MDYTSTAHTISERDDVHINLEIHRRCKSPPPDNMPSEIPSASVFLEQITNWDGKAEDICQALTAAFEATDYLDCIKDLRARNIDPSSYINSLDKVS